MVPQVIVELLPDGTFGLRLPEVADSLVRVRPGKLEQTIRTALHTTALGQVERNDSGAMTLMQRQCLRDHSEWPDARCPLCRAGGRFSAEHYKSERAATTRVPEGLTGAQIRALAERADKARVPKHRQLKLTTSPRSAEDLGL